MQPTNDNIGFCAVYLNFAQGYTRWPIKDCWRDVGEYSLRRVTDEVSSRMQEIGISDQALQDKFIKEWLVDLVIEAAEEMDPKTFPCRSYALMRHLGHSCFIINAETRAVQIMETSSWLEADQAIDAQEAKDGMSFFHVLGQGNSFRVVLPYDPASPSIAPGTFRGAFAPLQHQLEQMFGNSAPKAP